jgi:hypothetical protein
MKYDVGISISTGHYVGPQFAHEKDLISELGRRAFSQIKIKKKELSLAAMVSLSCISKTRIDANRLWWCEPS